MTLDQLHILFQEAEESAQSSDDAETKVGVMERAANKFVHNAKGLPTTRPDKYQYMIHAEQNLIFKSAARGLPVEDSIVICTLSPCQNCIRAMFQSGIREIYYKDRYPAHNPDMADIKVTEIKVGPYTKMSLTNYE
jgi:dCMP deaminase